MPSMPRLRTPARSQISAPSTPNISGVAIRIAAAQKLAENRMSKSPSSMGYSGPAQAKAAEEAAHDGAEEGERDDEIGNIARDGERTAHRIGADEYACDKDRGRHAGERLQPGEQRDDDAGIAEASREIGGQIALETGDLGAARKAGETAR